VLKLKRRRTLWTLDNPLNIYTAIQTDLSHPHGKIQFLRELKSRFDCCFNSKCSNQEFPIPIKEATEWKISGGGLGIMLSRPFLLFTAIVLFRSRVNV